MAESVQPARRRRVPEPSFVEFVALISFTMGLMSLSIDNLLPAFGAIQAFFGIADANEMQLIISAYMIAFALMQLFYGPLSDIIGRRPAMLIGLAVYGVGTVIAIFAPSFGLCSPGAPSRAWARRRSACSSWRSCATATAGARWRG